MTDDPGEAIALQINQTFRKEIFFPTDYSAMEAITKVVRQAAGLYKGIVKLKIQVDERGHGELRQWSVTVHLMHDGKKKTVNGMLDMPQAC